MTKQELCQNLLTYLGNPTTFNFYWQPNKGLSCGNLEYRLFADFYEESAGIRPGSCFLTINWDEYTYGILLDERKKYPIDSKFLDFFYKLLSERAVDKKVAELEKDRLAQQRRQATEELVHAALLEPYPT